MCGATPSRMVPGETFTPRLGTSANFSQQFGLTQMASERSLPILSLLTSKAATKLYVADVVAAVVHVHKPGNGCVFFCVFVVLGSLNEG